MACWKSSNPYQFGGFSAGHPVGPSVDLDSAFAHAISKLFLIKITGLAVNILCLHGVPFTIWIILHSMFFL
jgi:hypothetical protein